MIWRLSQNLTDMETGESFPVVLREWNQAPDVEEIIQELPKYLCTEGMLSDLFCYGETYVEGVSFTLQGISVYADVKEGKNVLKSENLKKIVSKCMSF